MWKELISNLTEHAEFAPPVSDERLATTESALDIKLPDDLKNLLRESNGVVGEYGLGLIWDIDRIETDNLQFRNNSDFKQLYMPFDHLLFFGDAGNGDQFAYPIHAGMIRRPDVFAWDHEDDTRKWVASSLQQYLEWWLNGTFEL